MSERERLDAGFRLRGFEPSAREAIWASVDRILSNGPLSPDGRAGATGLALGYVQSGKTTAITALIGAAADQGYRVVVALLGSTNLLLEQNQARLLDALGVGVREDYRWVHMTNPSGATKAKELKGWLERDRVVLVPVLKHAGRIDAVAGVVSSIDPSTPVLIVDDEADQASLNTEVRAGSESRTFESLGRLRAAVRDHLFVQFTATPYAPLLLEPDDHLRPTFVEILQPGAGYTGGREFFVDNADVVVRAIPTLDEQAPRSLPTSLPRSLIDAFGSFVAGTALLLLSDPASPPVSMLVHSTQRNDVQARYHFLLQRLVKKWQGIAAGAAAAADLPAEVTAERTRITTLGAADATDEAFLERVRYVLRETTLWLVNSASDVNKVDWRVAPVHVLVGGNKLDRGFTVEGLTVTYMNRPPSDQLDTLEQRARAFGYRSDLLPYCQFFATPRTLKVLRDIVDTEYDMRARLRDWVDAGGSVGSWAEEIGLLLPGGTRPTRQAVITALSRFNEAPTWYQMRRPSTRPDDLRVNRELVTSTGLLDAPYRSYGRLEHRTLIVPLSEVVDLLLAPWAGAGQGQSPGWRHDELVDLLRRTPDMQVPLQLLELPGGGPRTREWDPELGFVNLMQGPDPRPQPGTDPYPGDRAIGGVATDPDRVVVQIHRVVPKSHGSAPEMLTLAVHAGSMQTVKKGAP
jgi:hypothetical protein